MSLSNLLIPRRTRRGRWAFVLPLAAVLTLVVTACGSGSTQDTSGGDSPATGDTTPPSASDATPATPSGPASMSAGQPTAATPTRAGVTPIRVVVGSTTLRAELGDNAAARDLLSRLPITLTFSDFGGQEKTGHLDRPLSMAGMPRGADPEPNDIGWYAPSNDLVLYYDDVGYYNGIARLGRFLDPMDAIRNQSGDFRVTIERAN